MYRVSSNLFTSFVDFSLVDCYFILSRSSRSESKISNEIKCRISGRKFDTFDNGHVDTISLSGGFFVDSLSIRLHCFINVRYFDNLSEGIQTSQRRFFVRDLGAQTGQFRETIPILL